MSNPRGLDNETPGTMRELIHVVPFGGIASADSEGVMRSLHPGKFLFSVESETSADVADLISVVSDLGRAREYGQAFEKSVEDESLRGALFEASVVAYGRSFREGRAAIKRRKAGKGVARLKATKYLDLLDSELRSEHESLLNLRDRHVGHRVDNESSVVVAEFDDAGKFMFVSPLIWNLSASTGAITSLLKIVDILMSALNEEVERLLFNLSQDLAGTKIKGEWAWKVDPNSGEWESERIRAN